MTREEAIAELVAKTDDISRLREPFGSERDHFVRLDDFQLSRLMGQPVGSFDARQRLVEAEKVLCPVCQSKGLKSQVRLRPLATTWVSIYGHAELFWDEDGNKHTHDLIDYKTSYTCNLGHVWQVITRKACWCGHANPRGTEVVILSDAVSPIAMLASGQESTMVVNLVTQTTTMADLPSHVRCCQLRTKGDVMGGFCNLPAMSGRIYCEKHCKPEAKIGCIFTCIEQGPHLGKACRLPRVSGRIYCEKHCPPEAKVDAGF